MAVDFMQATRELEAVGLTMHDGFYYGGGSFGAHWTDSPDQATIDARNALILLVKNAHGQAIDHANVIALRDSLGVGSDEWLAYVACRDLYVQNQRDAAYRAATKANVNFLYGNIDLTTYQARIDAIRASLPFFSGKSDDDV